MNIQDLRDLATTHAEARYLVRLFDDPVFFLQELWSDRGLHSVAPLDDAEIDVFLFACGNEGGREHAEKIARRRVVLAFRGFGKTHLGPVALSCRRWYRDPNRQIVLPSQSIDASRKTVGIVREFLDSVWFLQHLAPQKANDDKDNASSFEVGPAKENRQPSMTAIGIGGQLENNRAHSVFPDDVETKANTITFDGRQRLRRHSKEFTNWLYPDRAPEDGGPIDPTEIVYFNTPKHEETIFIDLGKSGHLVRSWPIRYPREDEQVINLAPMLRRRLDTGEAQPGDPTVPLRFGPEEIAMREADGYSEFAMESMLIANLAESNRYPIRLSDLIVMSVHRDRAPVDVMYGTENSRGSTAIDTADIPCLGLGAERLHGPAKIGDEWLPYLGTKAWIDPAGIGNDRTGFAAVAALGGMLWVKGVEGLEGGSARERLEELVRLCRLHGATQILIETNNDVYGTYFSTFESVLPEFFVEPGKDAQFPAGWKATVEKRHSAGASKENRIIDALEPVISGHRMVIDREAIRPKPHEDESYLTLQHQLSRITRQRKCLREDGQADALAGCVKEWNYTLRHSPAKAQESVRQREVDKLIRENRERMARLTGRSQPRPNYIRRRR